VAAPHVGATAATWLPPVWLHACTSTVPLARNVNFHAAFVASLRWIPATWAARSTSTNDVRKLAKLIGFLICERMSGLESTS